MNDDIVKKLKRSIDQYAPVSVEDLREAVAEIERSRDVPRFRVFRAARSGWATANKDQPSFADVKWDDAPQVQQVPWSDLDNRPHARPPLAAHAPPAPDLEARLSLLECSVRDNTRRLDRAYRECVDIWTSPRLDVAFIGQILTSRLRTALAPGMEDTSDV